jgi:hypothetical protein
MPFTYDDFRANPALRIELRTFLSSDTGQALLHVMRQRYRAYDVPNTAEALVSARILSQFHGANVCLDEMETLSIPPGTGEQPESAYGAPETDHENMPHEDAMRPVIHP